MKMPSGKELCSKGLHYMTIANYRLTRQGPQKQWLTVSCRACYNDRLKKYMRKNRPSRAKQY